LNFWTAWHKEQSYLDERSPTVWRCGVGEWFPTFRRNLVPLPSTLNQLYWPRESKNCHTLAHPAYHDEPVWAAGKNMIFFHHKWLKSDIYKIQPDATVCRYLFTAKSLCIFRVSQHPSSGVLKTVTATSGTGPDQATLDRSSCTSIMTCTGGCSYSF